MTRYISVVIATIFWGCLAFFQSANAQEPKKGGTVCVMSAIGEEFHFKKIGIMVFGNEESKTSIVDWGFDDRVYALTEELLGEKFKIKRIKTPAEGFYASAEFSFRDHRTQLEEKAYALSADMNCSYRLLIVVRGTPYSTSNQAVAGIGVVEREGLGEPFRYLHAIAGIHLFDGQDHSLLNRWQHVDLLGGFAIDPIRAPHKELEITPETEIPGVKDREEIKNAAWKLLEEDLRVTLVELFQNDEEKKAAEQSQKSKKSASPSSQRLDSWPNF